MIKELIKLLKITQTTVKALDPVMIIDQAIDNGGHRQIRILGNDVDPTDSDPRDADLADKSRLFIIRDGHKISAFIIEK